MKLVIATVLAAIATIAIAESPAEDEVVVPGPDEEYWIAVEREAPDYPRGATLSKVNGCVGMSFVVEADGKPSNITVIASYPEDLFDRAAVRALKQWRFEPGKDNPGRVPALVTQAIDFKIEDARNAPVSCVPVS